MSTTADPLHGHRSIYTGRTTSWPMVAATSAGGVLVIVSGLPPDAGGRWAGTMLGLAALGVLLNVLTASSVRVTAGPNGFTAHWGVVGWPRCAYALDEIAEATVVDLPWWKVSWGFWWTPRSTCSTLRSGPTVRLRLRSGRTVTVTVPDPEAAVAALGLPG